MTTILVTTHAITGHLRYATPLVRELVAEGHDVVWYTGSAFEPLVVGTGATFAPMSTRAGADAGAGDALRSAPDRAGGIGGYGTTVLEVFVRPVAAFVADIDELIDSVAPEVVVSDHSFLAGMFAAERRGLPLVVFSTGALHVSSVDTAPYGTGLPPANGPLGRARNRLLYQLVRRVVMRAPQREAARIRATLGLPPLPGFFFSWPQQIADRYLQSSIPQFEYPRRDLPDSVVFCGPMRLEGLDDWTEPPWWSRIAQARAAGRPVVFVTQGTAATDPEDLLLPTISGLAGEEMQVVATAGGRDPQEVLPVEQRPPNLVLEPYIPFTEMLPQVDLMVTNGGFGGVQTALAQGVPLVVVGDSEDHMENNARVRWSGAGLWLRDERQTAERMRDAVHTVLARPEYRARARELMSAYARFPDGAGAAARVVLDAAATRGRRAA
ncbi:glycosyltransferase [Micromonospora sp. CA-240977]|uniref:glycosyltransferase n=1 Tax=Micromonospora sp. CA-240977 TaxID=3239957 RepID=UPI003D94A59B